MEGGKGDGSEENRSAGVRPQWTDFWPRLVREINANPENASRFDGEDTRPVALAVRVSKRGTTREVREKPSENPQIPKATVGNIGS